VKCSRALSVWRHRRPLILNYFSCRCRATASRLARWSVLCLPLCLRRHNTRRLQGDVGPATAAHCRPTSGRPETTPHLLAERHRKLGLNPRRAPMPPPPPISSTCDATIFCSNIKRVCAPVAFLQVRELIRFISDNTKKHRVYSLRYSTAFWLRLAAIAILWGNCIVAVQCRCFVLILTVYLIGE